MHSFWLKAYLKFLVSSTNQHGIHSPFVYRLVIRCFYDRKKYPAYQLLKQFRKSLSQEQEKIAIPENNNEGEHPGKPEKISRFFSTHGISAKKQRLLHRLARYFKAEQALIIGGVFGGEVVALSAEKPVKAYALEQFPQETKRLLKEQQLTALTPTFLSENFHKLPQKKFDIVYINPQFAPQDPYSIFLRLLPYFHNDSVLVLNEIHQKEFKKTWQQLKDHPQVKVSIDTFWLGFIFFRREQAKEHFKIRR